MVKGMSFHYVLYGKCSRVLARSIRRTRTQKRNDILSTTQTDVELKVCCCVTLSSHLPPCPFPSIPMTTPPLAQFSGQQAQAARDVNTASLCRIGQETVQDIVLRTMEIFQLLRNMQLPNGVTYHPNTHQDRLGKLQEHLRMLSVLFRKLRLVYDKCNENCAGLDPIPPEQLVPYVEDDSSKLDDRGASQMRSSSEERREILEVNKFVPQARPVSPVPTSPHNLSSLPCSSFTLILRASSRSSPSQSDHSGNILSTIQMGFAVHEEVGCEIEYIIEILTHMLCRLPFSLQKLKQKNQQLKQIMDQLRNLIWEINSMLAVRS
ncbi:hypothetical protein NFI96_014948 [Prochilodus magdalenae]|nr:hypothetical protein NFI96_014948 [Prochilodus magdalenae]